MAPPRLNQPFVPPPLSPNYEPVDYRHPLYVGDWRRSVPYIDEGFATDDLDEPHLKRRHTILKQYPEIKRLYGYDWRTGPIALLVVVAQLAAAYAFGRIIVADTGMEMETPEDGWWWWWWCHSFFCSGSSSSSTINGNSNSWINNWIMLTWAYVVGGTLTQLCQICIHESAHDLAAPTRLQNRLVGLVANISIPVPLAMPFRRYHLDHHAFHGVMGIDPELPMEWEARIIRGSTIYKYIWLLASPVLTLMRILAIRKPFWFWDHVNCAFTLACNALIWHICGWRGLWYLLLSMWFGYSLHPAAAHFISEHTSFDDGQETYSLYGGVNDLLMNIGHHVEHHDFTKISWSRLPEVRLIAPEYYSTLAYHTSVFTVHWNFITKPQFGPQSRVVRSVQDHYQGRKMVRRLKKILEKENGFE